MLIGRYSAQPTTRMHEELDVVSEQVGRIPMIQA